MKAVSKLLVALFLFAGISVFAQDGQNPQVDGERTPLAFLELTDDQQAQVDKIILNSKDANKLKKLDVKEKEVQLQKLMIADEIDEEAVMDKVDEIMVLKTELKKASMKTKMDIRSVLTPEQKAMYDTKMEKRMNRNKTNAKKAGGKKQKAKK